ncbi:hypothetical protein NDA11_001092 [Ustilago hordei]|nr:hypothetical protein NDA11_001092 [Ustilago hordei]
MRSFSLFLVLCIWVIGVIAPGDKASSSAAPAQQHQPSFKLEIAENPNVDPFLEKISKLGNSHDLYPHVALMRTTLYGKDKLTTNLGAYPDFRRFIYLGNSPGVPEMYFAVPLHLNPHGVDRNLAWSLIYAHSDQPKTLVHHGFVSASGGHLVLDKVKKTNYPSSRSFERGDVLTLREILDIELPALRFAG